MAAAPGRGAVRRGGRLRGRHRDHQRDAGDHGSPAIRTSPIPALDFGGAPTGIDVRLVVATGIEPIINTGIAHREAGVGQVGAGTVRAPMGCFESCAAGAGGFTGGRLRLLSYAVPGSKARPG